VSVDQRPSVVDTPLMKRTMLVVTMLLLGCGEAKSATGECLGWTCDDAGATSMMKDVLGSKYEPSATAAAAFDGVASKGVAKMAQQGFTPESFQLAKDNLEKFLGDVPEAGVDPLTPALEDLDKGTSKVCPLFPYC
jgi:hypothetical protein